MKMKISPSPLTNHKQIFARAYPGDLSRYENLSGLPPAWIGVGTLDLFHDEDIAYADRLRAAGVACELVIVPGAFHGFDVAMAKAPVSRDFTAAALAAVSRALTGETAT